MTSHGESEGVDLDHMWEAPSEFLMFNSTWLPGACAYRLPNGELCGVHLLSGRHIGVTPITDRKGEGA